MELEDKVLVMMQEVQAKQDWSQFSVIKSVEQPLAYPTMTPEDVWNWMGDLGIFFKMKDAEAAEDAAENDKTAAFGENSYNAFLNSFNILYTTEGLLFLRVKPDDQVKSVDVWDMYECIPRSYYAATKEEGEELARDIAVFCTHTIDPDARIVDPAEALELSFFITEQQFREHVLNNNNVRAWIDDYSDSLEAIVRSAFSAPDFC